jgi:anti-sigma factor RsiW
MEACEARLPELIDLASGSGSSKELEKHLTECAGCRAELVGLRETQALLMETSARPDDFSLSGFAVRTADRAEVFRDRSPRGLWWSLTRAMRVTLGFSVTALGVSAMLFVSARQQQSGALAVRPLAAPVPQAAVVEPQPSMDDSDSSDSSDLVRLISDERNEPDVSLDAALDGLSSDEMDELAQRLAVGSQG